MITDCSRFVPLCNILFKISESTFIDKRMLLNIAIMLGLYWSNYHPWLISDSLGTVKAGNSVSYIWQIFVWSKSAAPWTRWSTNSTLRMTETLEEVEELRSCKKCFSQRDSGSKRSSLGSLNPFCFTLPQTQESFAVSIYKKLVLLCEKTLVDL